MVGVPFEFKMELGTDPVSAAEYMKRIEKMGE